VIFNVVLTGNTFWHLRYFVCSLMAESDAQFRLVCNACTPDATALIHAFAERHRDRVVEVFEASTTTMVAHGVALDAVLAERDDGEFFCFVDPDIAARAPFLQRFLDDLAHCDAVTSGKELWTDDNVLPPGQIGVGGRHFYDANGFVFGSPHLALYRRTPLEETMKRWNVGLGAAGPDLSDDAREVMAAAGHAYAVYDTGKIVNILFQLDGHRLVHDDHPELVHIGGLSHFLSPPDAITEGGEHKTPSWAKFAGMEPRLQVAQFTALVMRSRIEERPAPAVPSQFDAELTARLEFVRTEMTALVDDHRDC